MTPAEQHAKLVREVDAANYRYYVLDDPILTDADFDALVGDLRKALDDNQVAPENRDELLKNNGHFVYRGYAQLARRFLFVTVFSPIHPIL